MATFDIDAHERLIDDLLKSGRIDRAKFDAVADDAEAVAALVRDAVGRELLAALITVEKRLTDDVAYNLPKGPGPSLRLLRNNIAQAQAAGIKAEG